MRVIVSPGTRSSGRISNWAKPEISAGTLFIYLIGDYMKLLLALFAAALSVACDSNAGLPTIDREMSNIRVDGGGTVRKFHDADTGVTCYYIGYRAMSCVKTN